MTKPLLAWAALLFSFFALAVAWIGMDGTYSESRAAPSHPLPNVALESEVRQLRAEVARLSEEVAWLGRAPQAAPDTREALHAEEERLPGLEERLAKLEQSLERKPQQPGPLDALRILRGGDDGEEDDRSPAAVARWQAQAIDFNSTEEEQVEALRALRGVRDAEGQDARSREVVLAMVDLVQRSESAAIRADVWRQLSRNTDEALLTPLLHSLANDDSRDVRGEAAETLADFLPDATVEAALRHAADHDPHADVREEASKALRSRRDR